MEEAGFTNVVSVPQGANAAVNLLPARSKDKAFMYVWNCWSATEQAARILLATDDDGPGHALAEELARRLGMPTCPCSDSTLLPHCCHWFSRSLVQLGGAVVAPD